MSTTATAQRPPSEAEIRALVEQHAEGDVNELVQGYVDCLGWAGESERGPSYKSLVWADLRPSEAARLDELIQEVFADLAPAIHTLAVERVTQAAMQFAAEFPDAPRATLTDRWPSLADAIERGVERALDRLGD